ncbi:MAG: GNAT family N-acetyltransferase [Peptostreptococcaceae bacterium]|jgi:spore coat polysaccharide biosynthesis protein SpsF (cytidylyltransferase family)/RimJ/RimL family protein N-acetyltransferase|nr:GNAT family N-acetyltransferase [Peptostreptococcaceae bacterium]
MENLYLRKVNYNDIQTLFEWSNEKQVRNNAFNKNRITYKEHLNWFENKIKNINTHMYIYMNDDNFIGQIRIDIKDKIAKISYSIDSDCRGLGLGSKIIKELEKKVKEDSLNFNIFIAEVKEYNVASRKIFLKNGYEEYFDENKKCFIYKKKIDFIGVIIQARYNSTRLKGKVMKKILNKPLLYYSVKRSCISKYVDKTIVAISDSKDDIKIKKWCDDNNIISFIGSENNVLERYYKTAIENNLKIIVRVTSDCPFVDPKIIDMLILQYLNSDCDYISNRIKNRTWPHGLDVEIFSFKALKKAYKEASEDEKQHVTTYILKNPTIFKLKEVVLNEDMSEYRLTVDYEEDFKLSKILLEELILNEGIDFGWKKIIEILDNDKKLKKINEHRKNIKL